MKSLTRIFTALAIIFMAMTPMQSLAQKGEKTFGVQAGYTSTNSSAIAGMFFQYGFSDHLRISPEMGLVMRHQDMDAFTMDVNMHFPLQILNNSSVQLYPLAGVDFSSWTLHHVLPNMNDDVSTRTSKFGINLGCGFQFKPKNSIKIKFEAKYLIMQHYSTFVASVGIGYVF